MTEEARKLSHSEQQAVAQLESIKEMVARLLKADQGDDEDERDEARTAIHEDALSVQVRYGWINPGETEDMIKDGPEEYEILLCTGGPACRIIGKLGSGNEPESAEIQHQDWGTPWTPWRISAEDEEALLTYARTFYFGD